MSFSSVEDLLKVHDVLDELLLQVRMRLPEPPVALLEELTKRLSDHMRLEEELLFPALERVQEELPVNGHAHVLLRDHNRLRDRLATAGTTGDFLERCESWAAFAGALEHHDSREKRWMKPHLDATMAPAVVRGWLDAFEAVEFAGTDWSSVPLPPVSPMPAPDSPMRALRLAVALGDLPAARRAFDAIEVPADASRPAKKVRGHWMRVDALLGACERAPDPIEAGRRRVKTYDRVRLFGLIAVDFGCAESW